MSTISTHILDTGCGKPANGVHVDLEVRNDDESWVTIAEAWTDDDGRVKPFFLVESHLDAGVYRLSFDTETYFAAQHVKCFYPQVTVVFEIEDPTQHYHIPLLLCPFGYSTYRGS
jgi:5-hydroxyisourate hydrolase